MFEVKQDAASSLYAGVNMGTVLSSTAVALKKTNFVTQIIGQFNESALLPLCYPCIQFYLLSSKGSVLYLNQKYMKITCSSLALFIYLFILFPLFY